MPAPARRSLLARVLALPAAGLLALAGACQSPNQFADGPTPTGYVPQSYQAVAEGTKLILTFTQNPTDPILGFNKWVVDGQVYVEPLHGTSTGAPPGRFELDLSGEKLAPNWPANVFWAYNANPRSTPNDSSFWIRAERLPWLRQPMTVTPAPAAATAPAPGAAK